MKKLTICLITLIMLLSIVTKVNANSDFMGLTDVEWKTYLGKIVNNAKNTVGIYTMTADETYMYERAYADYHSYYYQTNEAIPKDKNYTSYLKNSSLSEDIYSLLDKMSGYNKNYNETINSPNYYENDNKKTAKEIYASTDRRYWVKAVGNIYTKVSKGVGLTETEKKDLKILKELRKANHNFGTITKQEAAIYSKYIILYDNKWEKTKNIYEFKSFNYMIDAIKTQEENVQQPDTRNIN